MRQNAIPELAAGSNNDTILAIPHKQAAYQTPSVASVHVQNIAAACLVPAVNWTN